MLFTFGTFDSVLYGACCSDQRAILQVKPVQQSRPQALRAYCFYISYSYYDSEGNFESSMPIK